VSGSLAELLLDTLRLAPPSDAQELARRWSSPDVAARADGIAAWIAWEQAEQWLLRRLTDCGVLASVPPTLAAALQQAARRDAKAGLAVDADAADALSVLAEARIPCVLLKGPARRAAAASLVLGDARMTRDVDVLVRTSDAETAWRLFVARGWVPYQYDPAHLPPGETEMRGPSPYHLRTLIRPGRAAVELHVSIHRDLPPAVAWDRFSGTAQKISWQGLEVRVPAPTELLWHALVHARATSGPGWSLRYWLDAASVLAAGPVDWDTIVSRLDSGEPPGRTIAARWLSAATWLAGVHDPTACGASTPLALERLVAWRLAVLTHRDPDGSWTEKLLDEGTRAEAGLGLAPLIAGRAWPVRARRRVATLLARGVHSGWRLLRGRSKE